MNIYNFKFTCFKKITSAMTVAPKTFYRGYQCCSLTRNLQILGAFGHLSIAKGKTDFQAYIPSALETLRIHGAQLVYLDHVSLNEKAITLSIKNGFKQSNNAVRYYIDTDAIG